MRAYDQMMREQVAPRLREARFTGTLRSFAIRRGAARGGVRWQKDGRFARTGRLRFTGDVDYWCGAGVLAELFPAPARMTWWEVRDGEPSEPVADSVVAAVCQYVLPCRPGGAASLRRLCPRRLDMAATAAAHRTVPYIPGRLEVRHGLGWARRMRRR